MLFRRPKPHFIPEGFSYLRGSVEEDNYTICDESLNEFTWIPHFIKSGDMLLKGFYISTYPICKNEDDEYASIYSENPVTKVNWYEATEIAASFKDGKLLSQKQAMSLFDYLRNSEPDGYWHNGIYGMQELVFWSSHYMATNVALYGGGKPIPCSYQEVYTHVPRPVARKDSFRDVGVRVVLAQKEKR